MGESFVGKILGVPPPLKHSAEADLIGRLLSHDPKDRLRVEDAARWKDLVGFHGPWECWGMILKSLYMIM